MSDQPDVGPKAAFVAAVYMLAIGGVFALERVGAPDRLVAALGPVAALIGVAALGVLTRAKTLLDFLVARRAVPSAYAGLALAAPIGGFALAFNGAAADSARLPWRGLAAGVVLAALIVAPRFRATHASAMSDVFATRFPNLFTRVGFAITLLVCGLALAASGLGYAALTVRNSLGIEPDAALAICVAVLVASLAPGGLRGLVWTDAASAGAGFATVGLLAALSARAGSDVAGRIETAFDELGQLPGPSLLHEIAAAAAVASLFAFVSPALAAASAGAARRAGAIALLVLALGGVAAAALGDTPPRGASDSALAALIVCLPALALARAGLYGAARAFGLDLARAQKRLSVLASRRMALARGGVLLGACAAAAIARISPHPSAPLYLALGFWLAFATPSLLLSVLPGRNAAPAGVALTVSVAASLLGRLLGFGDPVYGPDLLVGCLGAGLAGFAVGFGLFVLTPPAKPAPPLPDPFVELPGV